MLGKKVPHSNNENRMNFFFFQIKKKVKAFFNGQLVLYDYIFIREKKDGKEVFLSTQLMKSTKNSTIHSIAQTSESH